ncbi:MAG: RluA family pseudouridine synthase [Actinobacteria bacterium]|nr:RluA family pseudouridine synthase [Actinomycetota bacterium]
MTSSGVDVGFAAGADEAGRRVDVVLARRAAVPRRAAQDALVSGAVTVGGRRVRTSHRMLEGETVAGVVAHGIPETPEAEDIPISVRYSDDRVLVVSKPAGIVTHPAGGHNTGTLVHALLNLEGELSRRTSQRPGIVHRLDKDTSGVLLVARDDGAHDSLQAAMAHRRIRRTYLALVKGDLPALSGTVDAPIGRNPRRRTLMAVVSGGRNAVTHYRVVQAGGGASLLEITLETGRTHQIRVHLAYLGNPVLGDRAYGGYTDEARRLGLERPWLHAAEIAFPHPDDGRIMEVTDPLPDDLVAALGCAGLSGVR